MTVSRVEAAPPKTTPAPGQAPEARELVADLTDVGYVRVEAATMRALLAPAVPAGWPAFASAWDDLGLDRFMADGGRYRRRRHAVFRMEAGRAERQPHQPHYQSRDYNRLNGGVERWFEPVQEAVAAGPVLRRVLALCDGVFSAAEARSAPLAWKVEVHQFRIEAAEGEEGRPTPEGLHRDGVDWVFVMLVGRRNVLEGVTEIGGPDGAGQHFTLAEAGDAVLLDDRRILHGVTPIRPIDPGRPAFRDVLVVTFAAV